MAWNNKGTNSKKNSRVQGGYPRKSRKERERELTDLAYKLGVIDRGLSNPDSRVSDSYNRGKTKPAKKNKKSLL